MRHTGEQFEFEMKRVTYYVTNAVIQQPEVYLGDHQIQLYFKNNITVEHKRGKKKKERE